MGFEEKCGRHDQRSSPGAARLGATLSLLAQHAELCCTEYGERRDDMVKPLRVGPFVNHLLWIERTARLLYDGGEVSRNDILASDALELEGKAHNLAEAPREVACHLILDALTWSLHAAGEQDVCEKPRQAPYPVRLTSLLVSQVCSKISTAQDAPSPGDGLRL